MVKFLYKRLRKGRAGWRQSCWPSCTGPEGCIPPRAGGRGGEFADGPCLYRDDRLGEGPFAGRESLWTEGRPVWEYAFHGGGLTGEQA